MKHRWIILLCLCFGLALPSFGEENSPPAPPPPGMENATTVTTDLERPENEAEAEDEPETMDIETVDGRIFRNATVERVTPSGIDIGYFREDGAYAMIGLRLAVLTPELQKEFGFDPEKAKDFEEKLNAAANLSLTQAAEDETVRMARVSREIQERFAGADIRIKPADLRFVIYALRRPVAVLPVERVLSGTVVTVVEDTSTLPRLLPPLVLIDRLSLPEGTGNWSGFIYPTGMHARYRELEKIPVYTDSLDEAQILLERYLDIYSEFAANADAQDQAEAQPPDQAAAEQPTAGVVGMGYNGWSDYPYYIGISYRPVIWWTSNHRPWPRPPRPYPPYPPRPPHPRPPHPGPGPGPRPPKPMPNPWPGPGPRPPKPNPGPRPPKPNPQPPNPGPRPPQPNPNPRPGTERNGGFTRIVPRPTSTPARPANWPGTPVPVNPPRPSPTPRPGGFGGPPR